MFHDIESDEVITLDDLRAEYAAALDRGEIDPSEVPFEWYVHNCLTAFGGTLERIF